MKMRCAQLLFTAVTLLPFIVHGTTVGNNTNDNDVDTMQQQQLDATPRIVGGADATQVYKFFVQLIGCGGALIWPDVSGTNVVASSFQCNPFLQTSLSLLLSDRSHSGTMQS
jgi:hypothetical protein